MVTRLFHYFSELGNDRLADSEARRSNRFHNRGLLVGFLAFFVSSAVTVFCVAAAVTGQVDFPKDQIEPYATAYFSLHITLFLLTLGFFFLKNAASSNLMVYWLYVPVHMVYVATLSAFLGETAKVQLLLLNFPPIAFFAPLKKTRPWFFLFFLAIALVGIQALEGYGGLYPVPAFLNEAIGVVVGAFVSVYLGFFAVFVWWDFGLTPKALTVWRRWSNYGVDKSDSSEARRLARLSNQGILILTFFASNYLLAIFAIAIWMTARDVAYWTSLVIFPGIMSFAIAVLVYSFFAKNKKKQHLRYELVSYLAAALTMSAFSILLGWQTRVPLLLVTFAPVPWFLNTPSRKLRWVLSLAQTLLLGYLFYRLLSLPPVYGLPDDVTRLIANIIEVALGLTLLVAGAYLWKRHQLYARFLAFWDKLTERGFDLFETEGERKFRKIQSGLIVLLIQLSSVIAVIEVGLYLHLRFVVGDAQQATSALLYYMPPTILSIICFALGLYWQGSMRHSFPAGFALVSGLAFNFFLGISHSPATLLYLAPIVALPFLFVIFNTQMLVGRWLATGGVLLYIVTILAGHWFHEYYHPIRPLPESYDATVRWTMIIFMLGAAVAMGLVVMRRLFEADKNLALEREKSEGLLKQKIEMIEYELEMAREIQRSILPKEVPKRTEVAIAVRYLPVDAVGGDYYSFSDGESSFGAFVADIAGHGLGAAMLAQNLHMVFKEKKNLTNVPDLLLGEINEALLDNLSNRFLTACYIHFDFQRGVMISANGGHPPLVVMGRGKPMQEINSPGKLIGYLPDLNFGAAELKLIPGQRIILYSDGIVEAPDPEGVAYADGTWEEDLKLLTDLSPDDAADQIIANVYKWTQSTSADDDLTLIVVDVLDGH